MSSLHTAVPSKGLFFHQEYLQTDSLGSFLFFYAPFSPIILKLPKHHRFHQFLEISWSIMRQTLYSITHAGCYINREAAQSTIFDRSDTPKDLPVTGGAYESTSLHIDNGNVWIKGTLVVQKGRALCFAAAYGGYTFIRRAGQDVIQVEGPGISAPLNWNAPFQTRTSGYEHVVMEEGNIEVGGLFIVRQGALFAHGIPMPSSPTSFLRHHHSRLTNPERAQSPAMENHQTHTRLDEAEPRYFIVRGERCISRYLHHFQYDGPCVSRQIIGLRATVISCSGDYAFENGNAWILDEQVIKDGEKLAERILSTPAPQLNMHDFWN